MQGCLMIVIGLATLLMIVPLTIALLGMLALEHTALFFVVLFAILGCVVAVAYFKSKKHITIKKTEEQNVKMITLGERFKDHCRYCGQKIDPNAPSCPYCGSKK